VDLLAGEHEVVERRKNLLQPRPFIDRQVGVVQAFMDAVVRRDGIALAAVLGHVGFQVGNAAVAQLGDVGQQAGLDMAACMPAQTRAPHRRQLFFSLAQQHQVVVVLLRERRARVVVDVVDQRRLIRTGQIDAAQTRKAARLVDDQPGGIQLARLQRRRVPQPFQPVPQDLVEHLPDDDRGMVAVAQHHLRHLVLDPLPRVGRNLRPVVHALDRQRAHVQHAHLVGHIVDHRRLRLAPGPHHVDVALFDQPEFLPEQFQVPRIGQRMGVEGLVEGRLQNDLLSVEIEALALGRELAKAEPRLHPVRKPIRQLHAGRRQVKEGIIQLPQPVAGHVQFQRHLAIARPQVMFCTDRACGPAVCPGRDRTLNFGSLCLEAGIAQRQLHPYIAGADIARYKCALNVDRVSGDQRNRLPDPAGDGAAPVRHIVPPQPVDHDVTRDQRRDHPHRHEVLRARIQQITDLQLKAGIAAFMRARRLAVDPHLRPVVDRLEPYPDRLALPLRR